MRRAFLLIGCTLLISFPAMSHASTVFSDNFESGSLSQWTSTNGQIVSDPIGGSNHVIHFAQNKSGGDAFTASSFVISPGMSYTFSFDYLGTTAGSPQAYASISPVNTTVGYWRFSSTGSPPQLLINDNTWHSYLFNFDSSIFTTIGGTNSLYLVFEQAAGTVGTAYFDNVSLSAVPIPAAVWLLGSGLIGLLGARRLKK